MDADPSTLGISFLAGVLSTLSPCVLPLLPVLIGSALGFNRWGPLMLSLGVASSFTVGGVLLASLGIYLGLNSGWMREGAAVMLIVFGAILLSGSLQARFASAAAGLGAAGQHLTQRFNFDSLAGQFVLGFFLGLVWSPCVGPTLGTAVTLASQQESLGKVTVVMAIFGFGAAMPLALVGGLSREALCRVRGKLIKAGVTGKYILGGLMMIIGIGILTGVDRYLEAHLLELSPDWLLDLTTRY